MDQKTIQTLLAGLIAAFAVSLPSYNWIYNKGWNWAESFPLGWLGVGLTYMSTFFHELGHTVTAWFYGYPTLPTFDFQHGGGMAWHLSDQQIMILIALYVAIFYGLIAFKTRRGLQILLLLCLVLNLATAFNEDARQIMISFMGPAAVSLVAAFLLVRALFDLAPRGWFERFLNAAFGFGMIFLSLIECWALWNSKAYRLVYFQQKGQHGFGDFDKINARLPALDFNDVVLIWAILSLLCLIAPFILFLFEQNNRQGV